jgi:uncharacterized membrane protein
MAALAFFLLAWLAYGIVVERAHLGSRSLNRIMNGYRRQWMEQLASRENRLVDASINGSLQNGTAFFASTSLIAVGGVLTLLRSTDDVLTLFGELPFATPTSRVAWEAKVIGLAIVFVYAFFKFAWAYRLFNYAAILIGAVPMGEASEGSDVARIAGMAADMNIAAGKHFNRGQRTFFFALAYLGWFLGPEMFFVATAAVLVVTARRHFSSDACDAVRIR